MPNIISVSRVKKEIQARDVSDIAFVPKPYVSHAKEVNQHRFKWYFRMREYS